MKRGVLPAKLIVQTITRLADIKPGDIVVTMELHVVGEDYEMRKDWIRCTEFDHIKNEAKIWPYIKTLGVGQQSVAKVLNVKPVTPAEKDRD